MVAVSCLERVVIEENAAAQSLDSDSGILSLGGGGNLSLINQVQLIARVKKNFFLSLTVCQTMTP